MGGGIGLKVKMVKREGYRGEQHRGKDREEEVMKRHKMTLGKDTQVGGKQCRKKDEDKRYRKSEDARQCGFYVDEMNKVISICQ